MVAVAEPVGVFALGLQPHEIDDVDNPDLQRRWVFAQNIESTMWMNAWQQLNRPWRPVSR